MRDRRHFNAAGTPKTRWATRVAALVHAVRLGAGWDVYRCPVCAAFHVGARPRPRGSSEADVCELGVRASSHLRWENTAKEPARRHAIRQRFERVTVNPQTGTTAPPQAAAPGRDTRRASTCG